MSNDRHMRTFENLRMHLENNSIQFSWEADSLVMNIEDPNVASMINDLRNSSWSIDWEVSDDDDQPMHRLEPPTIDESLLGSAAGEVALVLKPAAEPSVETLEKMTYEGPCCSNSTCGGDDDQSELTCVICMENVLIGSHLTRMPCSHLFHGGCILNWLKTSHTCPICRFELPLASSDDI